MPNHSVNLVSKRSWSMMSKVADKSKSERAVSSRRSSADKISFWIYRRAVSVEFPHLIADWRLFELPEFCMWDFIWLATIFSINLETQFNPDTGLKLLNSFRSSEGFFNNGAIVEQFWRYLGTSLLQWEIYDHCDWPGQNISAVLDDLSWTWI